MSCVKFEVYVQDHHVDDLVQLSQSNCSPIVQKSDFSRKRFVFFFFSPWWKESRKMFLKTMAVTPSVGKRQC